jgi:predicted metal-dependent phosphoesterase TrpH
MIDLHCHTTESDGSLLPCELIETALAIGLEALAITDHDTFAGFDQAAPLAKEKGLELVCGLELSTKFESRTVHLIAYFLGNGPEEGFRQWILQLQESRFSRNMLLLDRLKTKGISIAAEDLNQHGPLPGRPHIARIMVERGFVSSMQQAFDEYLDESACCYVPRQEPSFSEAVERIKGSGGLSSLPHPGRVSRDIGKMSTMVHEMRKMGLAAIEVYHSDHSSSDVALFSTIAEELGLSITGGSDFHGQAKPDIELGTGRGGNLCIPYSVLDRLRSSA